MGKECLVFLTKRPAYLKQEKIEEWLSNVNLQVSFVNNIQEYIDWSKNCSSDLKLFIFDGKEKFLDLQKKTLKHALILWVSPDSRCVESAEFTIYGFKTYEELIDCLSGNYSNVPLFIDRIIKPKNNSENDNKKSKFELNDPVNRNLDSADTNNQLKEEKNGGTTQNNHEYVSTPHTSSINESSTDKSIENNDFPEPKEPEANIQNKMEISGLEKKKQKSPTIQYQENPYYIRSRNLQKQIFSRQKWETHKMIGVWSPLHRIGVTTFTVNFAFHLAKSRIYTAVLEGLTEQRALIDWLKRYTRVPDDWISYAKAIQLDGKTENTDWTFHNVKFLPLDHDDSKFVWDTMSLESYMTTTKIIDATLVDLPTGKMSSYTLDTLHFLDELWIIADDSFQEMLSWKGYIQDLSKQYNLPFFIVFNKTFPFSQAKRLAKTLDLPLLTKIPALHEEVMRNYYESTPLYFIETVSEQLEQPFSDLTKHLFGEEFTPDPYFEEKKPLWPKLLKILKV